MNQQEFFSKLNTLSLRRRQVLSKILAGESNRTIAQSLSIEEATVRKHLEKICEIFGIKNEPGERFSKRPELITLFSQYQLVPVAQRVSIPQAFESPARVAATRYASLPEPIAFQKPTSRVQPSLSELVTDISDIYDRDVFILIDQSGSMVRKDADTENQTRYEYLEEVVEGHVFSILNTRSQPGKKKGKQICDHVQVYFFNRNKIPAKPAIVTEASQLRNLFLQNSPRNNTRISPTLNHCLDHWQTHGKQQGRGAFIIIYTDGLFNDESQFVEGIARACTLIDNHQMLKIFVLGIGQDIDVEHFLELDFDTYNRMPFNIFVFDLVNEVEDIVELLKRQLIDTSHLTLPNWVRQRHPTFSERVESST
ncbi:MAG: hypothetical protein Kow00121_61170 [Elainellaceae cyanobacterium]